MLPWFCVGLLVLGIGCSGETKKPVVQLSGTVTFNNSPVPAGYISFSPISTELGAKVVVAQIKDGAFTTATLPEKGFYPGEVNIQIAGFNGKAEKFYPQGKQIFNPHSLKESFTVGEVQKNFDVPASAAKNLRIEPTADE
jgi:hypothetical protein